MCPDFGESWKVFGESLDRLEPSLPNPRSQDRKPDGNQPEYGKSSESRAGSQLAVTAEKDHTLAHGHQVVVEQIDDRGCAIND